MSPQKNLSSGLNEPGTKFKLEVEVFCAVTQCTIAVGRQRFGWPGRITLKVEAEKFSET